MRPDSDRHNRPDDASVPPDEWAGVCVRYLCDNEDDRLTAGDTVYCCNGPDEDSADCAHTEYLAYEVREDAANE